MRREWTLAMVLVVLAGETLRAQDTTDCAARLAAPTADSVVVTFGATVTSTDEKRPLPPAFAELLAEGLRQHLRLPVPLLLTAFEDEPVDTTVTPRSFRAFPTLSALYVVTLDGARLRDPRFVSGTVAQEFDGAVHDALVALDSSGDVPPLPDTTTTEPVLLSLSISRIVPGADTASQAVPLFRVRLPARPVTRSIRPRPGTNFPLIPRSFRPKGLYATVKVELRVNEVGEVAPSSVRIVSASSRELALAVFPRVPQLQFLPMQVQGCPVTSVGVLVSVMQGTLVR